MKKYCITTLLFLIPLFVSAQIANPKYELRGAWVATVANIDWPTEPGLPVGKQIIELVQMFDSLKQSGINAIFFQVRTESGRVFELYYDRAPKSVDDRKGGWFLYREMSIVG